MNVDLDFKILEERDNLFFRLHKIRLSPDQVEKLKEEKNIVIQNDFLIFRFANSFYVFPSSIISSADLNILFEKGFVVKAIKDQVIFLQLYPLDTPKIIRQAQGIIKCNNPDVEIEDHVMQTLIKTGKKDIVTLKYRHSIVKAIAQWNGQEFIIEI